MCHLDDFGIIRRFDWCRIGQPSVVGCVFGLEYANKVVTVHDTMASKECCIMACGFEQSLCFIPADAQLDSHGDAIIIFKDFVFFLCTSIVLGSLKVELDHPR